MKKIIIFLTAIGALLSLQAPADSQVTVFYPGQAQTALVSHAGDLLQLVNSPALQGKSWWPGTVIAEKQATAVAINQQQQLLARLQVWRDALRRDDDMAQAAVVENVRQQVAALRVTGRQNVALDPDLLRLRPQSNRHLLGEYSIYTLNRPSSVMLAGAVDAVGKMPWVPGRAVADYLAGHTHSRGAERSYVQLISPAGDVTQVPVAYWNRRHIEPQVGSIIFVGFSSWTLPGDLADVNQQLVSVLMHRIPD